MPTILVVDDDFSLRKLLCDVLKAEGYTVLSAPDVDEALWLLDQSKALSGKPDVCVVDFHLGRKTGYDLIQEIRQREGLGQVPVIMLTATQKNIRELVQVQGVEFISKSSHYKTVLERVRAMAGPPAAPAPAPLSPAASAVGESLFYGKFQTLVAGCLEELKSEPEEEYSVLPSLQIEAIPDSPVARLLGAILAEAVAKGAAHLDLEPRSGAAMEARVQSGGSSEKLLDIPARVSQRLVAHLKGLCRLNIVEAARPQKGTLTLAGSDGKRIECTVNTLPTELGEKVTLSMTPIDNRPS